MEISQGEEKIDGVSKAKTGENYLKHLKKRELK